MCRVKHLARYGTPMGIMQRAESILAVAENGMSNLLQVYTDLMSSSGLDPDAQVTGLFIGADKYYAGHGFFAVNGLSNFPPVCRKTPKHKRMVDLDYKPLLKQRDHAVEGCLRFSEQEAAGGIAIEAVDKPRVGAGCFVHAAQSSFDTVRTINRHAGGFVNDHVMSVFKQDARISMAAARPWVHLDYVACV